MATKEENLALERPGPADEFLALIEKVALNPDIDAEKLKVIVSLKLQLEDRAAEKAFDGAMQEAQKEVKALKWDKLNKESSQNRWVSFPKIDEMLQPIREKWGFSESFGVEPELPAPNLMMMYSDVTYKGPEGTHRRRFHLPMSISGEGPKGGGVMTAAQGVGNGSSYGMRYLEKLIWKIPMLVDRDDNDGNAIQNTVNEKQLKELQKLFRLLSVDRQKKALEHFGLDIPEDEPLETALANVAAREYNNKIKALAKAVQSESKNATVSEEQEATLVAIIEGIGGTCKADFLKANKIKKISEMPAHQYQGALAALEKQRRKQ
jgi:hypothetical protein